jgi:membrane protein
MKGFIKRQNARVKYLQRRVMQCVRYVSVGVWRDTRQTPLVNILKTLNLSVRSFFNSDIQTKACGMTYRTLLALVPALALVFAIGRGFGLQDVIRRELIMQFMSQREILETSFDWVDSYLSQSSGGVFVGVGIVVLLWTLVSMMSAVEKAFNHIWGIRQGRSLWRKLTDYLAIFLLLPVLVVCGSGLSMLMQTTLHELLPFEMMPIVSLLLDLASLVILWLFFAGTYMLIPNTRVKFKNAFIAGAIAGTAYAILQWLFISGTLFVSKYNAIYGSFAFVPLFLVWLQLVWVITFSGAVICYSSQNIFKFNFSHDVSAMSLNYRGKILVAIMSAVVDTYVKGRRPLTEEDLSDNYDLPTILVSQSVDTMIDAGLLLRVMDAKDSERPAGLVPALETSTLTVGDVMKRVRDSGAQEFLPGFEKRFPAVIARMDAIEDYMIEEASKTLIKDLYVTGALPTATQQN